MGGVGGVCALCVGVRLCGEHYVPCTFACLLVYMMCVKAFNGIFHLLTTSAWWSVCEKAQR